MRVLCARAWVCTYVCVCVCVCVCVYSKHKDAQAHRHANSTLFIICMCVRACVRACVCVCMYIMYSTKTHKLIDTEKCGNKCEADDAVCTHVCVECDMSDQSPSLPPPLARSLCINIATVAAADNRDTHTNTHTHTHTLKTGRFASGVKLHKRRPDLKSHEMISITS
jgi:hypothetical protein